MQPAPFLRSRHDVPRSIGHPSQGHRPRSHPYSPAPLMFDEQGSPGMYANILLSTDGSDVAKKGVKHGLALAKALNAKVTVISVTEPPSPIMWMPTQEDVDRFDAACKEHAGKVLDEARAMAEHIGISAELLHVPNAHPATAIIETAKSRGCDLIVMASHGRRGIRKLLLGSQTSEARRRDQSPRAKRKGLGSIRPECVNQPDRPACAWPFRVGLLRSGNRRTKGHRKTEPAYPHAVLAQRGR